MIDCRTKPLNFIKLPNCSMPRNHRCQRRIRRVATVAWHGAAYVLLARIEAICKDELLLQASNRLMNIFDRLWCLIIVIVDDQSVSRGGHVPVSMPFAEAGLAKIRS
jgi:hypothetical protein